MFACARGRSLMRTHSAHQWHHHHHTTEQTERTSRAPPHTHRLPLPLRHSHTTTSMDDLFDSAHSLEQDFIEEGAKDGRREGKRVGLEEGRMLGVQKGFEIGAEVGQYAGFVRMLRALQQQQQQQQQQQPAGPSSSPPLLLPPLCSARIERNLCAMEECLLQFPLYDPLDESLHDLLEALRGKHKAISTALGVTNNSSSSSKAADAAQHLPRGSQQQQPGSLAF